MIEYFLSDKRKCERTLYQLRESPSKREIREKRMRIPLRDSRLKSQIRDRGR